MQSRFSRMRVGVPSDQQPDCLHIDITHAEVVELLTQITTAVARQHYTLELEFWGTLQSVDVLP